jgi:hypothetical protein
MAGISSYVRHVPRHVEVKVITGPCVAVGQVRDEYLRALGRAAVKFEQWDWRNDRATIEIEVSSRRVLKRAA